MAAIPVVPIVLWLCRAGLCLVFVYSGVTKLIDFHSGVAEQKQFGMPFPVLFAVITIAVQLGCPTLIFFFGGIPGAIGSLTLAGFTLMATFVGHPFWRERGKDHFVDLNSFLEHFGMISGFVLLALIDLDRVPGLIATR
jgi:transmembrane protein